MSRLGIGAPSWCTVPLLELLLQSLQLVSWQSQLHCDCVHLNTKNDDASRRTFGFFFRNRDAQFDERLLQSLKAAFAGVTLRSTCNYVIIEIVLDILCSLSDRYPLDTVSDSRKYLRCRFEAEWQGSPYLSSEVQASADRQGGRELCNMHF